MKPIDYICKNKFINNYKLIIFFRLRNTSTAKLTNVCGAYFISSKNIIYNKKHFINIAFYIY